MKKYHNLLTSTTLIPLWAKAVESVSENPILMDPNAYPTLKSLGYDLDYYDKDKQNPSQVGCCLRAKWIDDEAIKFINANSPCQVIQLGAGIDDRFRRLGMPKNVKYWYDLDLDEVAEMRREVIPAAERNEIISMNMFNTTWMKRLKANHLPTLIIIEGVMMYLQEDLIQSLFNNISTELGDAVVLFDSVPALAVGKAKYHDSVKKYNKKVEYTWGLKNAHDIENLSHHVVLLKSVLMSDLPQARKFKFFLRIFYRIPYFHDHANQLLIKINIKGDKE